MIRLKDISIRNKLIGIQVFTSVLVLAIFSIVFIANELESYRKRKIDDTVSLAGVVGSNVISTLTFDDGDAAREILETLRHVSPEILYAGIVDKNGKVFAGYSGATNQATNIQYVLGNDTVRYYRDQLYLKTSILDQNKRIGTVLLLVDLVDLAEMKKSTIRTAFILLFAALILAFMIAIIVQTTITHRLTKLVSAMQEVSRAGNYDVVVADDGKDEISTLTQGFNQFNQQIKANLHKKDEFIGIASHELKTPLTSIKGYLELLKSMEDRPGHLRLVEKAGKNVVKLENLIRDLLDVSKIQGGQLELNCSEFDLVELIEEIIAALQPVFPNREITHNSDSKSTLIYADRQRIEQVLINLLSNAMKYSPVESKVEVASSFNKTGVLVKVRDFGVGITPSEQSKIFERFYRAKDASIHIAGFGLGLYICKDIVSRHEGKIWVESNDKGSTFFFTLPQAGLV
ncbi:MAG: ATP-binding protein [Chitinophagaceae bacterium]